MAPSNLQLNIYMYIQNIFTAIKSLILTFPFSFLPPRFNPIMRRERERGGSLSLDSTCPNSLTLCLQTQKGGGGGGNGVFPVDPPERGGERYSFYPNFSIQDPTFTNINKLFSPWQNVLGVYVSRPKIHLLKILIRQIKCSYL